jgi:hypothetical protein
MATPLEFAQVMAVLAGAIGKRPEDVPKVQADVYHEMLGHFPGDVLRAAAIRAMAEHRIHTLPPVGLIVAHARDLTQPPLQTAEAWEQVRSFAVRWSCWFLDGLPTHPETLRRFEAGLANLPPQARAAANAYGWRTILETDPGVAFAQFRGVYESLAGRERTEAALPPAARLPKSVAGVVGEIGRLRAADLGRRDPAANGSAPPAVAEVAREKIVEKGE